MKHTRKGILMVTMMATLVSFANENDKSVVKDDIKKTAVTLTNVKVGDLLTIKDYNGLVLYKESIEASGIYQKGFDLSALPNGDYFFEVDKDMEIKILPFTVKAKKVTFLREKETSVFKPYIKQKDDMLFISKLSLSLEPLKIKIYSDNNSEYEMVYSDVIEDTKTIEKAYKLKKGGDYKIVLSSNERTYTKFINN
ncbi:hypothetical protein [Tamlana sedimenti]|uniref:hypothetical protein n=1 Tax=Tamlana sedimenti TaxID=3134126 RepID=UPI00403E8C4C